MDERHQSAIEERIKLLDDFRVFLQKFFKYKELKLGSKYLYVIKPTKKFQQDDDSLES